MSRRRFYAIGFTILALLDTSVQIALKFAARHTGDFGLHAEWFYSALTTPWTYVAIVGYLGTFFAWMTLLEYAPIGPAFAVSHLQVVTVLIVSVPLFHEFLSPRQIAGAVCIAIGIALFSVSESKHERGSTETSALH